MATVEGESSATAEKQPDLGRYKYVIEKPASDVSYRSKQTERAGALDRMFEGKDKLSQPLIDDIADEDFFMRGQARQQAGEVKRLIPDRFFEDEEAKKEVGGVLDALREGRSLGDLLGGTLKNDKYDVKKLEAIKLAGARLLQEHHPETQGRKWREISEEEKRTVRMAEMMIHTAEMGALKEKMDDGSLDKKTAETFAKNYSHYAKNVDISKEQQKDYIEVAKYLKGEGPEPTGVREKEKVASAEVSDDEYVFADEEPVESGRETAVGAAEATVVERGEQVEGKEKTGERTVREIEEEMRDVYGQIRRISEAAGSGALGEQVRARKQPEIEKLRQRWQELRDEIHTRAAKERLQGVTIEWLEKVERELGEDVKISPEEALDWAEEHDWEEKGKEIREKKRRKVAPYVKRGKKLKPLRKNKKL